MSMRPNGGNMLRLLAVAALVGALGVAPTQAAAPRTSDVHPLTIRSTGPTSFAPATKSCPVVRIDVEVVLVDTRTPGNLEICVRSIRSTGAMTQVVDAGFTFTSHVGMLRAVMTLNETEDAAHTTLAQQ